MLEAHRSGAHKKISEYFRAGYYFNAFDEAMTALPDYPDDIGLKHVAVLSLLRGGALQAAETLFEDFNLAVETHEDILALSGRLVKGQIEELGAAASLDLYTKAALLYEKTYELARGSYSGVNAASLWYMAGDKERAEKIATDILTDDKIAQLNNNQSEYYRYATRAECLFILGEEGGAKAALDLALSVDPGNYGARASTLRQFKMLGGGQTPACAEPLQVPRILHYTGHLFYIGPLRPERSLTPEETETLSADIKARLNRRPISSAFGALAAGADILFAESLLELGIDLHVVLPVPAKDFKRLSVTPMGAYWEPRFEAALARAKTVRVILEDPGDFDGLDLKMGSLIAMGLTRLAAERLNTDPMQISVMDKESADTTLLGTRYDIKLWHEAGGTTENINWPHSRQTKPDVQLPAPDRRFFRAMLFTDLKGYGRLPDRALPDIVTDVFEPMAKRCQTLAEPPLDMKSWGDGLFLVFETPLAAARAAFEIMDVFNQTVASKPDVGERDLSLRIGVHFGPVWERQDPFTQSPNLYGRHVTTAARLEALAIPGTICVSENFAAVIEMMRTGDKREFICDYAGRAKSKKEETEFSLYSLRKAQS